LGMQFWLSLTKVTDYAAYCTNVDLSFDEVCIWGCRQLRTSLSVTKILDLQGDPHLRWYCELRSTGLCYICGAKYWTECDFDLRTQWEQLTALFQLN
jgi:hypothetical protein